ncbi:MAG: NAD(+)/NADH kinase [Planctomycetaceae bacterium]|nr:NAD(+)/NADH kinase [Planctomycetaceae bacterium]
MTPLDRPESSTANFRTNDGPGPHTPPTDLGGTLPAKQDARWAQPPRVALLSSASRRPDMVARIQELRPMVEQFCQIVYEDYDGDVPWNGSGIDLSIVFGGDGSILRAARKMGDHQRPVLAVNLGRLGFLADIMPEQLPIALQRVVNRDFAIVEHLMIQCMILREGQEISNHLGLNEVALRAAAPFNMQQIDLYIDGRLATSYNCDGLIISTPVGSTAHNLSVGGPIIRKDLRAFVIAPISPHTLTVRPVVDTADRVYEMLLRGHDGAAAVVLDGKLIHELRTGESVQVRQAEATFRLIEASGQGYYATLREKLGWSGDLFRHRGTT